MQGMQIIDWTDRTDKNNYSHREKFLILHHTVTKTAEETLNILNKTGLSIHYIVEKDGTIYQTGKDHWRTYHAGVSQWGSGNALRTNLNDTSIGIEIVNMGDEPFPEAQMQAVVNLSRNLMAEYGITAENILAHAQIAVPAGRKCDPSGYFDWKFYHTKLGLFPGLYDTHLTPEEQKEVILSRESELENEIQNLQSRLSQYGYKISVTGIYDEQTMNVVEAHNRRFCPEIFYKENIENNKVIQDPRNTQWYRLSEERLSFLLSLQPALRPADNQGSKPSQSALTFSYTAAKKASPTPPFAATDEVESLAAAEPPKKRACR